MFPEFDKLPSVMTYEEVEFQFRKIMDIAESNENLSVYSIQDALNDGLFSLEYNPKGRFSSDLSRRVICWVQNHWDWEKGDLCFIEGLCSLYINFAANKESKKFFATKLATETRDFAKTEILDVLENDV